MFFNFILHFLLVVSRKNIKMKTISDVKRNDVVPLFNDVGHNTVTLKKYTLKKFLFLEFQYIHFTNDLFYRLFIMSKPLQITHANKEYYLL